MLVNNDSMEFINVHSACENPPGRKLTSGVTKILQDQVLGQKQSNKQQHVTSEPHKKQVIQVATSAACASQASSSWMQEVISIVVVVVVCYK